MTRTIAGQTGRGHADARNRAAQRLWLRSAGGVHMTMRAAASGDPKHLLAYALARARHHLLQAHLANDPTEPTGAEGWIKRLADASSGPTLDAIARSTGKTAEALRREASFGSKLETPLQLGRYLRDAAKSDFDAQALEYALNSLAATGGDRERAQEIERALAALGTTSEGAAALFGTLVGIRQGVVAAAVLGDDDRLQGLVHAVGYARERAELAYRYAARERRSGAGVAARIAQLVTDPPPALMAEARRMAAGPTGWALARPRPGASPPNGDAVLLSHLRWARFSAAILALGARHGDDRSIAAGAALALAVGSLVAERLVNGSAPAIGGIAPSPLAGPSHAVRLGPVLVATRLLGPLGAIVGIVADLYAASDTLTPAEAAEIARPIIEALAASAGDAVALRRLAGLIRAVTAPHRFAAALLRDVAASPPPFTPSRPPPVDTATWRARSLLDGLGLNAQRQATPKTPSSPAVASPAPPLGPVARALLALGLSPAPLDRSPDEHLATSRDIDPARLLQLRLAGQVGTPQWRLMPAAARRAAAAAVIAAAHGRGFR